MTLLRAADIHLAWGARTLFNGLTFVIEEGERVGLVGVNGSGKSTLMKILAGSSKPDTGLLQVQRGARLTYLPQEPVLDLTNTVQGVLSVANPPLRAALEAHEALVQRLTDGDVDPKTLDELSRLSEEVDRLGGWNTEHVAKDILDRLGVKAWDQKIGELSGGLKKRVAIAQALLSRPDLLLLDEPTNHLDADTTDWLEEALDQLPGALLLVTHDRYFLDGLVDRIVEIEPDGTLTSYPGNYHAYVEQRLERVADEKVKEHKRGRWIAQEVAWLRKGAEARRTKSRARIQRAEKLMSERKAERPRVAELQLATAPRAGHITLEARAISKNYGPRPVFGNVDLIFQAGERIGIVGPNGAGKTTLLRVLLGELAADAGEVRPAKNLKIAYFDQHREQLDPELTVYEAAWHDDYVTLGDTKMALRDYLDDLLFPVPMQKMQVKALSGGEKNRLLLARLFLQGANLLALDEPTNDLDLVTLNILEQLLRTFSGTVLLVTHDRYFLDKVATTILAVEGDGHVTRYEGNYSMYRTLRAQAATQAKKLEGKNAGKPPGKTSATVEAKTTAPNKGPASKGSAPAARMTFKEKHELDGMEKAIEEAESNKRAIEAQLNDPTTYAERSAEIPKLNSELAHAARAVEKLYARWEELTRIAGN